MFSSLRSSLKATLGSPSPDLGQELAELKQRIQEGLRRAYSVREEFLKEGVVTLEAGENETLQVPRGCAESLVSASWAAGDGPTTEIDVLARLKKDILAGEEITARNDVMGGDPKPGTRKVLRVKYRPVTEPIAVSAGEGQELRLPAHAMETILTAEYGAGDTQEDVMMDLQAALLASGGRILVSNELLGGDPLPGVHKTLTVKYHPARQRMAFKLATSQELATFSMIAPGLFHDLRTRLGLSLQDFFQSLTSEELQGGEKQASGKSGEIFWFTKDKRYVLKTISDAEVSTLVHMLREYTEYLAANPDSLLTRYLGVFSLEDNGTTTQFVVMNDIFEGSSRLDTMYDLKGTTEDRWVQPEPGKCLKDNNFAGVTVYCADDVASRIHRAIASDTRFLEKQGIMDYSLMLALAYDSGATARAATRRYSQLMGGLQGFQADGVLSVVKTECTFFIGLVDMLVTYGWKKVAANTVKRMTIGLREEIDTVAPDRYAVRFRCFFAGKLRGRSEQVAVTEVPPDLFETPMPPLGRSGGTAAFFKVTYKQGAPGAEAQQSPVYWIGKDLARAKDEVGFYESAKALKGKPGWDLLAWMTPYAGVCRAMCEVEADAPPRPVDVMLLRNGRDGFRTCRMLDIKIGQATAVAGWQGKSTFSAWLQSSTIDAYTNSAGQGFRLEGFDNPPDTLRSIEELLTSGHLATSVASANQLKRFNLQRMTAGQFMSLFLDLHETGSSSFAKKRGSWALPPPLGMQESSLLLRVEAQELVLLSCIEELAAFISACRRAPTPQQWIGSSVMLCFDSGSRPSREALARGPRQRGVARVHVFDWGRSELNTACLHERQEESTKAERRKYWGYYCAAVTMLLYDCCSLYISRFWYPKRSLAFTLWDKDRLTPDEFVGTCCLRLRTRSGQVPLTTFQGAPVKSGFLFRGETKLGASAMRQPLPEGARLEDCWAVRVHGASDVPRKDMTSPSDCFVEVAALADEPKDVCGSWAEAHTQRLLREGAHVTSLAVDIEAPVWEEDFEIATLCEGAKASFLMALAVAFGSEDKRFPDPEALVRELFPCRVGLSVVPKLEELQQGFALRCFPNLEIDGSFRSA